MLHPLIVVLLFIALVLLPGNDSGRIDLATGTLGDVPAMLFPIWAWVARALPDTQPDEQRALSATAARHRLAPTAAGLLAAYLVNLGLGALALAIPLFAAVSAGVGTGAIISALTLLLLVTAAATLLGAYTARAIMPSPGISLLALLSTTITALLLSIGPLHWLSVPMAAWLRAAHDGPTALTDATPTIALHLTLWSATLAIGHLALARRPR
ncbi:hypothetical protein [Thermomonospora umbrina]|uniref:hypothetical protein n=1 Tax=Thermomonospora umbrina TaxID=111806 RepID=UPI000E26B084|nr:hypothetical protein [Thermomonospora umbrina]